MEWAACIEFFPSVRIEETWRLWQKFLDDYSRFEDWLKAAERTAACPNSSEVLYTVAKEELKRFEVKTQPLPCPHRPAPEKFSFVSISSSLMGGNWRETQILNLSFML